MSLEHYQIYSDYLDDMRQEVDGMLAYSKPMPSCVKETYRDDVYFCKCGPGRSPVRMCSHGYRRSPTHMEWCELCDHPGEAPPINQAEQEAKVRKRNKLSEAERLFLDANAYKDWQQRYVSSIEMAIASSLVSLKDD